MSFTLPSPISLRLLRNPKRYLAQSNGKLIVSEAASRCELRTVQGDDGKTRTGLFLYDVSGNGQGGYLGCNPEGIAYVIGHLADWEQMSLQPVRAFDSDASALTDDQLRTYVPPGTTTVWQIMSTAQNRYLWVNFSDGSIKFASADAEFSGVNVDFLIEDSTGQLVAPPEPDTSISGGSGGGAGKLIVPLLIIAIVGFIGYQVWKKRSKKPARAQNA